MGKISRLVMQHNGLHSGEGYCNKRQDACTIQGLLVKNEK